MINLRASSLPRILTCSESMTPPFVAIETPDEAARLGTAVHEYLAAIVNGTERPLFTDLAAKHHVDADEVAILSHMGRQCWEADAGHFPDALTESNLGHVDAANEVALWGHPDVIAEAEGVVRVGDWKTGLKHGDHADQLRGYMFLGLQRFPAAESAWGVVYRVRDRQRGEPITMTRREALQWWEGVVERVNDNRSAYVPTIEHCQYCPRRFECDGRRTMLADATGLITGAHEAGVMPDDDKLAFSVAAARALIKILEAHVVNVKTERLIRPIAWLEITTQDRRELDPVKAWPVLATMFGEAALLPAIKIGLTKLQDVAGATAPKGHKKGVVANMNAKLEEAGAITRNVTEILKVIDTTKAIGEMP